VREKTRKNPQSTPVKKGTRPRKKKKKLDSHMKKKHASQFTGNRVDDREGETTSERKNSRRGVKQPRGIQYGGREETLKGR